MRKLFAGLMATALIATAFVFPANAAYTATENFHVYINGGSVVSSKRAEKQLATALPMWAWAFSIKSIRHNCRANELS